MPKAAKRATSLHITFTLTFDPADVTGTRLLLEPRQPVAIRPTTAPAAPDTDPFEDKDSILLPPDHLPRDAHYFYYVQPEDSVHFQWPRLELSYALSVRSPPVDMPPLTPNEEVQVQSSGGMLFVEDAHQDQDSETDEEADLDGKTTPAAAASRAEVGETPHHRDAKEEEAPPFSTAREQPANPDGLPETVPRRPSSELGFDAAAATSPAVQAAERSKNSQTSQVFASSPITKVAKKTGITTYAARDKRSRSKSANTNDDEEQEDDSRAPNPTTSDALYPEGVAHEVAERSLPSKKRVNDDTVGDEPVAKARKVEEEDMAAEPAALDGDQPAAEPGDDESDNDGPSQIPAGPKVSSGRLPHVPLMDNEDDEAENDDEENDEGEEITVEAKPKPKSKAKSKAQSKATSNPKPAKKLKSKQAAPKPSPEVVVRPQRLSKSASRNSVDASGTPQSTAASVSSISGKAPKVLFSTYTPTAANTKFLKAQGSQIVDTVATRRTNFLCVVKDNKKLLKTPKVLRSLALGKGVVTTQWIEASKKAGELLDPAEFVHAEVADTMDIDRRQIFSGKILYFTNKAVEEYGSDNWLSIKELGTEAGAISVDSGTGGKGGAMTSKGTIIYIGTAEDPDATTLIEDYNCAVYNKDIIRDAVVAGEIDLEDEQYRLKATKVKKHGRR